jgi:hypothetical protein
MLRGLPKFFNLGQLAETRLRVLRNVKVLEVTEKLDGQMITGVEVGEVVQFWSRKGLTAVGRTASRVAAENAGYEALVREATALGCTAVFELVGRQSRIKAYEGNAARLVLIAVREVVSGDMWGHSRCEGLANKHVVEVVKRFSAMGSTGLYGVMREVRRWKGREGVIVRLEGGVLVKVKSNWWFRVGVDRDRNEKAVEWKEQEQRRVERLSGQGRLKAQRLAVVGWQMGTSLHQMSMAVATAVRLEAVYGRGGKLKVVMAAFGTVAAAQKVLQEGLVCGGRRLQVQEAYSNRTGSMAGQRVETWERKEREI